MLYSAFLAWLSSSKDRRKCRFQRRKLGFMDADDPPEFDINDTPEKRALQARLSELREEHRALDAAIAALQEKTSGDMLQIARLKRGKLVLKDQIQWIEDRLTPDIIA
jgi:hypothetical protein